jgi:hypothetical protein
VTADDRLGSRCRAGCRIPSNPEAAGPRHFRLDPYVTATPEEFHREDDAHNDVLRWMRENTRPVLFLSGVSGSGKSSVLEAYVLPLMQADGWRIGRVRSFDDPLPQLEAALIARRPRGTRLLIVFDQSRSLSSSRIEPARRSVVGSSPACGNCAKTRPPECVCSSHSGGTT